MGFFTEAEESSLRIRRMNFQIVGEEEFTPRAAMAGVEYEDFFLDRIRDVDAASIFTFSESSQTKALIEQINATGQFARGAAQLASNFDSRHVGQSSTGAFFTFEMTAEDPDVVFYAMLKYDYREVLAPRKSKVGSPKQLRKIVEAFVQDKRALQKSAIVRVRDGTAEDEMSAKDRNGRPPDITDFFAAFLEVKRSRSDFELTGQVVLAVTDVLRSNVHLLPEESLRDAVRTVRERLRTAASLNDRTVLDAVLLAAGRPPDQEQQDMWRMAVATAMRRRKVAGLEIPPDQTVLRKAVRRKIVTSEDVRIDYPESLEGQRVRTVTNPNGGSTITITTDVSLEVDEIVTKSSRSLR